MNKNVAAIICAAGASSRFGGKRKKAFVDVAGRAVFLRSVELFSDRVGPEQHDEDDDAEIDDAPRRGKRDLGIVPEKNETEDRDRGHEQRQGHRPQLEPPFRDHFERRRFEARQAGDATLT